jgi:DNA-binding winged helix-turn-helix (wHTH) protein
MPLQFGDCVFDLETRELSRDGEPVNVSPKAFRLLEVLIERRPKAISKDDLQQILWPKTFVSEGNLARLVTELRHAIGDNAEDPHLLRTVHGFGYAFSGSVDEAQGREFDGGLKVAHRLYWGSREIALDAGRNVLGRDRYVSVFLDHRSVSRSHASITISGGTAVLEDLQSKNGTFLRGERITAATRLSDGDEIRLGTVRLIFRVLETDRVTDTAVEE